MNFAFKSGVSVGNCSHDINIRRNTTTSYRNPDFLNSNRESNHYNQYLKFSGLTPRIWSVFFFKNKDLKFNSRTESWVEVSPLNFNKSNRRAKYLVSHIYWRKFFNCPFFSYIYNWPKQWGVKFQITKWTRNFMFSPRVHLVQIIFKLPDWVLPPLFLDFTNFFVFFKFMFLFISWFLQVWEETWVVLQDGRLLYLVDQNEFPIKHPKMLSLSVKPSNP